MGVPALLSAEAVPAEVEAPVGAKAGGALVTGGSVVTGDALVTGGAGAGCADDGGGTGLGAGIGSFCSTVVLSDNVAGPKYACVIQITVAHKTIAAMTARTRIPAMRLMRLNGDIGMKRP